MHNITEQQIDQFVTAAHEAGGKELMLCSSGNLSMRVGEYALVSGTGSWLPRIRKEQVSICKIATGEPVNGVKPSMESTFHLGIMRNRPDVNCVLHFQSAFATTIACRKEIPTDFNVTAEVPCYLGNEIPVIPYYRPGSPELAKAVSEALVDHDAALLRKHGQVVCGKDFEDAYQKAVFFEMACSFIVRSNYEYVTLTKEEIADLYHYIKGKTE